MTSYCVIALALVALAAALMTAVGFSGAVHAADLTLRISLQHGLTKELGLERR